ncbi:TPA: class I adenylate cyclase, partial [Klebsiella pneumoniae]
EDTLTLVQQPAGEYSDSQWALYPGNLNALEWPDFAPIKRSRELIELLAWCHRNGVIDNSTRLTLHPGDSDLSEFELGNLLLSLQHCIPLPLAAIDEEALLRAAEPVEVLLLVNVGLDPLKAHSQLNIHLTSEHTDSLGYAGVRENLVQTIDQVTLNSWNELMVNRYDGPDALLDCLRDHLNSLSDSGCQPNLRVRCFCRNRATAISQRVEELFRDNLANLASHRHSRYLLQIRQRYHVLDLARGQVSHRALAGLEALIEHLGAEQPDFSPLHVDHFALQGHDLALILPQGRADCIQVFYRVDGEQAELSVLDEHNALWRQRQPFLDEASLLRPLHRFLQAVQYRRNALLPLDAAQPAASLDLRYYEVLPAPPQRPRQLERRTVPNDGISHSFYDVQCIVEPGSGGRHHSTLYCDHREFSELEYGPELFRAVA